MDALAPHIHDWQLSAHDHKTAGSLSSTAAQLADDLVTAGILRSYCKGSNRRPAIPPPATRDLASMGISTRSAAAHGHWGGTFSALISADIALRVLPLWRIVGRISSQLPPAGMGFRTDRLTAAVTLAQCFHELRPWFPRNYLCLFDSLALTLFLIRRDIHVRWIFGVREDPFAAHCWVQYGDVVLNEHLDRSRLYTPVMAV